MIKINWIIYLLWKYVIILMMKSCSVITSFRKSFQTIITIEIIGIPYFLFILKPFKNFQCIFSNFLWKRIASSFIYPSLGYLQNLDNAQVGICLSKSNRALKIETNFWEREREREREKLNSSLDTLPCQLETLYAGTPNFIRMFTKVRRIKHIIPWKFVHLYT